jgi:hypothetical protein
MKICRGCGSDIVYGFASSANNEEKEFMCDECLNTMNAGYHPDGTYEPPAFFPVRHPGHC